MSSAFPILSHATLALLLLILLRESFLLVAYFMSLRERLDGIRMQVFIEQNVREWTKRSSTAQSQCVLPSFLSLWLCPRENTFKQKGLGSFADVLFNQIHMLNHMARHLRSWGNRQQAVGKYNAEFCASLDQFRGDSK
jgi:hypothetical protein